MKFNNQKKIYRGIVILLSVFILSMVSFALFVQKAHAQSGSSLWKMSGNLLSPVNNAWNLKIPGLNSTGTTRCINVLANGTFEVASDECGTGGGGGGTVDGSGTANQITYWVDSNTVGALTTATYPSLSELAFGKGVTSAIQTQLNAKAPIASPTFTGTVSVPATNFTVGASLPFSDSAGTLTLQNIDLLDATAEATIESAIDTLANLVSIQGRTVTLADAGADAILGWDDSANAYQNLSASDVRTVAGVVIGTDVLAFSAYDDATSGEVNTGTSTAKYVSPDSLAGSNAGIRYIAYGLNGTTALTTSNAYYRRIPAAMTGMNLVSVTGSVGTGAAGSSSSGTPTFTVKNVTDGNQMLSTSLTIDASEYTSATAATPVAINTSLDDVVTDDLIEVAVTTAGTGVTYAVVTLGFQLP